MAIEYDKTGKLFQVDYQAPFGGLDTTAYASAINPKNFADTNSVYVEDNVLKPVGLNPITPEFVDAGNVVLGFIPIGDFGTNVIGFVITTASVYSVTYALSNPLDETSYVFTYTKLTAYTPLHATDLQADTFSYLVIDQVGGSIGINTYPNIYWTISPWTEIWTFNPNTNTASQLTGYCGGGKLGLLDNQFLNLGGWSAADGYTPNRISWSAPGQYGQFQPYNVALGTGNYSAGFNDLPSTSDIITGYMTIGTVGYIFRFQGITQMNPTGNGIQPFSFNHLWASELGVGSVYAESISQYGPMGCFVANDGVYSLGLTGLNRLGDAALSRIFKQLNLNRVYQGVPGRLIPNVLGTPELMYILGIPINNPNNTVSFYFIGISINENKVIDFQTQLSPSSTSNASLIQLSIFNVLKTFLTTPTATTYTSLQVKLLVFMLSDVAYKGGFFYFLGFKNTTTGSVTFRKEQFKFGYWPTVSKVGFLAALIDTTVNGRISVSVDGGLSFNTAFPDVVITPGGTNENGSPAGTQNPGAGIIDTIYCDGVQTLERPQLILKLTNVQLAEAWYQGTLADYPVI